MSNIKSETAQKSTQEHLAEAERIFIDFSNYNCENQLFCYRLMKHIFENSEIPSNSVTIDGLLQECNKLSILHAQIIYYRYNLIKTYKEIAHEVSLSITRVQQTENIAIRLLRNRMRFYYLPKRQVFLVKYNRFLDSIQTGTHSEDDINIDELGLSIRTSHALKRAGIYTASQLFRKTKEQLFAIPHLGQSSIEEILNIKKQLLIGFI